MKKTSSFTSFQTQYRGIVLLIVLAVLAMVSVLALSFISMARLERSMARNYVDSVRAMMIAESGIEAAVSEIQSWSGTPTAEQLVELIYNPSDPLSSLAEAIRPSFPVEDSPPAPVVGQVSGYTGSGSHISKGDFYKLKVEDESGKLNLNDSNELMDPSDPASGRLFHITQKLAERLYPDFGLAVAGALMQKRVSLGGRFVNLTDVAAGLSDAGIEVQDQTLFLRQVTLWSWVDPNTIKPSPAFRDDGSIGGTGVGGPSENGFYQDPQEFKYAFWNTTIASRWDLIKASYGDDIYDWRSMQHKGMALEPRAPVNLNTASVELLAAVLEGLQGLFLFEYGRSDLPVLGYDMTRSGHGATAMLNWPLTYGKDVIPEYLSDPTRWFFSGAIPGFAHYRYAQDPNGNAGDTVIERWKETGNFVRRDTGFLGNGYGSVRRSMSIRPQDADFIAQSLYDRIHVENNPFESWQEFKNWVNEFFQRDQLQGRFIAETRGQARLTQWLTVPLEKAWEFDIHFLWERFLPDLLMANFCPNTQLNDFNAGANTWKFIDKADMLHYSTEFCLEPTGVFAVVSVGTVMGVKKLAVAERTVETVIEMFKTARITSQSQFFPDLGGGLVASQSALFGVNRSAVTTAGARSVVADPLALDGTLTQSWPEPLLTASQSGDTVDGRWIRDNHYDGGVGLATVQSNYDFGISPQFRVSFNGTLNADVAIGDRNLFDDPEERPFAGKLMFTTKEWQDDPSLTAGNLYADGAYSEPYRTLIYHSIDNVGGAEGRRGSLMFWIKPNWQPEFSPRPRKLFSMTNINRSPSVFGANFGVTGSAITQYPSVVDIADYDIASDFNEYFRYLADLEAAEFTLRSSEFVCYFSPSTFNNAGEDFKPTSYSFGSAGVSGMISPGVVFGRGVGGQRFASIISDRINFERVFSMAYSTSYTNPRGGWKDRNGDGLHDISGRPIVSLNAHRWNYMALAWDQDNTSNGPLYMRLNDASYFKQKAGVSQLFFDHSSVFIPNRPIDKPLWHNPWPVSDEGDGLATIYGINRAATGPPFAQTRITALYEENPIRFGEFVRGAPNYSSDSTYDEILILPEMRLDSEYAGHYNDGRYYRAADSGQTAHYTTPPLTMEDLQRLNGANEFQTPQGVKLRSLSWTLWWSDDRIQADGLLASGGDYPRFNHNPDVLPSEDMNPFGSDHPLFPDDPDPAWAHVLDNNNENIADETWATDDDVKYDWDPMTVDVQRIERNGDSTWLFAESEDPIFDDGNSMGGNGGYPANQGVTGFSRAGGTKLIDFDGASLRVGKGESIRLRFFFNEKQPFNQPIQESPILDDITITFTLRKPTVLRWRVVLDS